METEKGSVHEWKIENLSHWCAEVHGHCIRSPVFSYYPYFHMELYPKGIGGQGEHLVVRLCDVNYSLSGELSFHSSDGSLLCSKQQVKDEGDTLVQELPPGPKFEDVLSRIRESEDFITVTLRVKNLYLYKQCMRTVINGLKISVKINPKGIEEMKSVETKDICEFSSSLNNYHAILLETCSENDLVHFMIKPRNTSEYPFAVEMCLTRSDGTVDSCVKKEHLFRGKSPWRFPDPMKKKELGGKGISIFLCVKTKNVIQSPAYYNWDHSNVSIEFNNTPCSPEKAPSMAPVTSNELAVRTKDSGFQIPLNSHMPDDSVLVLSKELMCIYQDQKFSDITLKCDNVTFPVHKNILSGRSPVFDRLLYSDMREAASGTVDIGDLDPSTVSLFLTYLYTGVVEDLQDDRALKLYYAADKYQVPSLKRDCSKFLCANLSLSNVCDILSLGDRHQDEEITAASHDFILDNFNAILKSNEWESFMSREPLLAVKTVTHFAAKESVVRKHDPK